ncbi:MAG: DUF268 domain-containing protein [Campylobacteraceae bacterium]|jgi:hypothetical protein|nr:DUF268 domain-containing protein [Campylobacteraceae bacterium]
MKLKRIIRKINNIMIAFGIIPRQIIYSIIGLPRYLIDLWRFKKDKKKYINEFPISSIYPCLTDRYLNSGITKGHYFHQDLLVARRIYANNPKLHIDIGSRTDGFVAHVASFRRISVIDIRPQVSNVVNISFIQQDIMSTLKENVIHSCDSLSCLHALEHFGLGRYGDSINYNGHIMGLDNLYQMLKKNGKLYFSVPIGLQRIEFNAHRVFSVQYLLNQFEGRYNIDNFSFVDDNGDLHENVLLLPSDIKDNFGCLFGCGIFEMTKL